MLGGNKCTEDVSAQEMSCGMTNVFIPTNCILMTAITAATTTSIIIVVVVVSF